MDLLELQRKLLSPKIKLLGDILGEVITEQTDKSKLHLEEEVRLLAKKFREENDLSAFNALATKLQNLDLDETSVLIQAFSLFFQLVNLAEEDYRISTWDFLEKMEDTVTEAIREAKNSGYSLEDLLGLLTSTRIKLVWTAHPTEARRLTNMIKLRKIYNILKGTQDLEEIKKYVTLIWQSDDIREERITILDEVRNALFYFDNTIFDILPDIILAIETGILQNYGKEVKVPRLLEFGSWIGGDRDGHPGVTSSVTIQTLLLHKRLCLRKYLSSIKLLLQDFSSSTNIVPVSKELEKSISKDEKLLPEFAAQTRKLNQKERYRRKLDLMRIKLENTLKEVDRLAEEVGLGKTLVGFKGGNLSSKGTFYSRSRELLEDLQIIERSLKQNKGKIICKGTLEKVILQVRFFGFHLAPLDLRQHSGVHETALFEIFEKIGMTDTKNLPRNQLLKLIRTELVNPRPLGVKAFFDSFSSSTKELISTLEVAKDSLQKISPRSIESYIISMSRDEVDILTVMLLMKEVGLVEVQNSKVVKASLDIVPLFETREDLAKASSVLRNLFVDPLYRSYLDCRDMLQEIMIGYSDSGKDAGILQSNYSLYNSQLEILQLAKEHAIKVKIFHGRGGSVSRGGGPTHKAILGIPYTPLIKITEQGEVIGWNYSNPHIARRHLEQIISAMIIRGLRELQSHSNDPSKEYNELFGRLASESCRVYEKLVKKDPGFIRFYLDYTPIDAVERATIGSRPSRRKSGDAKSIDQLRAIPWVFSWMQTRAMFPSFYGSGTALEKEINDGNLQTLQEMYQTWPYFNSLINNMQMVMAKADYNIARKYVQLVKSNPKYFEIITQEFEKARSAILRVTGNSEPLSHAPDILNSIKRRNVYIDPLHLIQIRLLEEWRQKNRPEDMSPRSLLRLLLLTQNGIAAGMRNTG